MSRRHKYINQHTIEFKLTTKHILHQARRTPWPCVLSSSFNPRVYCRWQHVSRPTISLSNGTRRRTQRVMTMTMARVCVRRLPRHQPIKISLHAIRVLAYMHRQLRLSLLRTLFTLFQMFEIEWFSFETNVDCRRVR